ncbi:hypothetical protein [Pimelobacter simplex]|uniref:Uncharacterized protein n=1 Tax=Nocardioides simplex TaxID=2045 RepID=A0A0A1DN05_NOCSI|nr:hypothetical protein [Pimelobacter simplex]AIY18749.1 hypothetical protein KR76_21780 [Pimelobacter simplex]GEB14434.1 hypothetical protein NSI01_27490 [Pimelobacter simplex]SFM29693.1 hypothetical protein SAMN05421671_0987 [Pimelobacter simplex]
MSEPRRHHRPAPREARFFDEYADGIDPALLTEAAERAAVLLVRGAHSSTDTGIAERLVHLADTEGIEALADLWSHAPAETLAGCLWRLYLLRSWVYADPTGVARQFESGRQHAEFARVVAGVADPPGPDELRRMVDEVLRGIAEGDFADVLFRAAAFARVVAAGRATLPDVPDADVRRMLALAEQLEAAGHLELSRRLG